MNAFVNLAIGTVVQRDDTRYVVSNLLDLESFLAKNLETGAVDVLRIGEVKTVSTLTVTEQVEHCELSLIEEDDWDKAEGWHGKLKSLLADSHRTKEKVKAVAEAAGVHVATVYRKLLKLERTGRVSALIKPKPSGGKGKSRLCPEVEAVISDTIDHYFFNKDKKRRTKIKTVEEIERRLATAKLPLPHRMTILNKIAKAESDGEIAKAQEGAKLGAQQTAAEALGADYPLAIVQIDHTQLDIMVVDDERRLSCGKPWITVAIDVFSRLVVGFYISLDPPGNTGTGQCIARSILMKETWLASFDITTPWPCWGIMDKIHADNAGEFRGHMLKRACKEYSIDLEWRPVKKPQYGSYIERLLGTFLKEIHELPGSTESNPRMRGEYDSEKHAVITMDALDKWLALYITGVYHQKLHTGIGMTPINRYSQGILGTHTTLGRGYPVRVKEEDRLYLDLLPAFKRTIQTSYGVHLDQIGYKSAVLSRWVKAKDPENPMKLRKFIFKRNPRDISHLYFFDPDIKLYFRIPYRDSTHPPMSIWQYRKVRQYLRERGLKEINEQLIFESFEKMRAVVIEETKKSKAARREEQRDRMNKKAKKPKAPESLAEIGLPDAIEPSPKARTIKPFEEILM